MPTIKVDKLMSIIIICLSIIVVICGIRFFTAYKQEASWDHPTKADDFVWRIQDKQYSNLVYVMHQRKNAPSPKGDLKEYMAIAEYYKNTSYYKMYNEVGDTAKAEEYLVKITDNIKDIVDLTYVISEINEDLGVE